MKYKYLKIISSVVILAILVFSLKDVEWKLAFKRLDLKYIPIIFILLIVSLFLRAWRWQILMNDKKVVKISLMYSIKLLFIGQALNIVMPSGAGDVAKSYFGYKDMGNKERMLGVSLYDKLMAISSIGFLSFYSSFRSGDLYLFLLSIFILIPLFICSNLTILRKIKFVNKFILFLIHKLKKIDFKELMKHINFSSIIIFKSLIISIAGWILTYLILYYSFLSFTTAISLEKVFENSPIITIARLFPFTLNGIGTDEALMMFLFSNKTQNESLLPIIFLGALFYRLITVFVPAIVGLMVIQKK